MDEWSVWELWGTNGSTSTAMDDVCLGAHECYGNALCHGVNEGREGITLEAQARLLSSGTIAEEPLQIRAEGAHSLYGQWPEADPWIVEDDASI